ncbi:FCP1-like phosphatase, phosphatase domain protein [Cordyceps fumosorosea ARSEF 2679]|uniref:RNA polymerase II subunit A C-terminal domain phosphatase n=1 Tax=Cordyceps fumosorosea (strain ARSEF 2679) TaxID=1081104 RepID=A0A168EEI5_CORFA|nr:FCP1-like phosphatase, phosphatase domain protein [Cordyceps fumosorosea ARSEF 2679]OAA73717.1 FCP1-like phosphatase, phosphatase domain protein [Cordyceps fumosorosea ARSEF 2679]
MYDKSVSLGSRLRYPITITKLLKSPGDPIKKQENIIEYKFTWRRQVGDDTWVDETTYTEFDSPAEGKLKEWRIKEGQVIAADMPCMTVEEACGHQVQIQGMCSLCGADMTETNWASEQRDSERAMINMTHDQTGLMVSESVAQKAEHDTQKRLLRYRKLSLVVDLDQTIIHACIEPTVGEWQRDPSNPNHSAVKNIRSFQLDDGPRGLASGCTYYIKLRPGLKEFLQEIAKMYELHVYTMGTRAYALNVAKIVDPDRKLFGNRVISRDENGSITSKSLARLFPVSTDMVVIIDDRADVWPMNRPNLIKVVPYDFFKGVGDINGSFLPKRQDISPAPSKSNGATEKPVADGSNKETPQTDNSRSNEAASLEDQAAEQEKNLEKQLTDRPLLHMQEELDKEDEKTAQEAESGEASAPHQRHNLLSDDDEELVALQDHLTDIHTSFYEAYDRRRAERQQSQPTHPPSHSSAQRRPSVDDGVDLSMVPDVGDILDEIKSNVLSGLVIVLSGLVPLGVPVEESEIGMQAQSFGAQVLNTISKRVTHLVVSSSTPRTNKVQQAAKIPSIKIVNQNWLIDCLSQWRRLDERPYYLAILDADREKAEDMVEAVSEAEEADTEAKDLKDFDWDMADKDLQDFLDDDEEGDSEGGDGNDDDESSNESEPMTGNESDVSDHAQNKGLKRKAAEAKVDDGESDTDGSAAGESVLAKKQRLSRSRGTSALRSVQSSNDNLNGPGDVENGTAAKQNGHDEANADEEELGFDEADLERDLLAELEAAGD